MRVELAENGPDGRVFALPDEVAAGLARVRLVEVRPYAHGTWHLVPLRNAVGAVRVGDLDIVVQPKAPFASVLFMLGYARDPGFTAHEVDGLASDDLWAAVGETLARLAERALFQGVLQGYVTRDDSLAVLRGRMRAADQVARRPGTLLPLEVTYDEYEVDIVENQILRAALRRMGFVPRLPDRLRSRLQHLGQRLNGASSLVPGAPVPRWSPSRANLRYQPALRVADLVLRSVGLSTAGGKVPVASFVVDMAKVFEDFVGTALRDSLARLSPGGRTVEQYREWLDEGARVRIRPDVVHLTNGLPRIVVDAKYKLGYDDGGFPTADVYQVLAYCTALGLSRGYLVYAGSRADGARPSQHRVLNTAIDVVQWPLDVADRPLGLTSQVASLAAAGLDYGIEGVNRPGSDGGMI